MRALVTGAAGFVGGTLTDRLLHNGHPVIGYDNSSTGRHEFLENAGNTTRFELCEGDLLDLPRLKSAMAGHAVAIVGCGLIGTKRALAVGDCRVRVCCDTVRERADRPAALEVGERFCEVGSFDCISALEERLAREAVRNE